MPTGQRKSLCYQLPATLLPGLTLVVSPLIALMQDQVEGLKQSKISAAAFHSALTEQQRDRVIQGLHLQSLKLLYVAPERIQHEAFLPPGSEMPGVAPGRRLSALHFPVGA